MEQKGIVRPEAAIKVLWDEDRKGVKLQFDSTIFQDWIGVRALLWAATQQAKQMHQLSQMKAMAEEQSVRNKLNLRG